MEYFLPPFFNYYKTLLSFTIIQICENLTRLVVGILVAEVTHLLRFHDFFCALKEHLIHRHTRLIHKHARLIHRLTRPERAEAPSPGHRPGDNGNQQCAL